MDFSKLRNTEVAPGFIRIGPLRERDFSWLKRDKFIGFDWASKNPPDLSIPCTNNPCGEVALSVEDKIKILEAQALATQVYEEKYKPAALISGPDLMAKLIRRAYKKEMESSIKGDPLPPLKFFH